MAAIGREEGALNEFEGAVIHNVIGLDRVLVRDVMTPRVLSISAVTLATQDMARAVQFYRALGFVQAYGGETAAFTSFRVGQGHVNLIRAAPGSSWGAWGRVIFYVDDVDAMYAHARAQGFTPQAVPENAPWGERFFHLMDPDGHELSFAQPLPGFRGSGHSCT